MTDPVTVTKPWGDYQDIFRTKNVVFKKITVKPGEAFSYQKHQNRTEFWYCQQGEGILKFSDASEPLSTYRVEPIRQWVHVMIAPGNAHQIENTGKENLIIYEMQCGECSEDDIIRLADKYGRS